MADSCDLSWLFGADQGPKTIRLIDSDSECRRQLELFAAGAVYTDGELSFHTYRPEETEAYRDLQSHMFAFHDPSIRAFGATEAEFKQCYLKEMLELTDYLPYSLCMKVSGELAGCITSHTKVSETKPRFETPTSEEIWNTKIYPPFSLLSAVQPFDYCYPDDQGRLPPNSVDIRTVLHVCLVSVAESFGGRNFCYKLYLISAALGYLRNLTLVIAECTNGRSSNLYKIGGYSMKPMMYSDIVYDGKKAYPGEEDGVRFAFLRI